MDIRLILISCIEGGYARREFSGIESVLKKFFPVVQVQPTDSCKPKDDDETFYIVADYYYNPTFDPSKHTNPEFDKYIRSLPPKRTAIYLSDPLFKFEDPAKFENWKYFVFFGLSNFKDTWKWEYDKCKIWENIDISKKEILNLPISELAFRSYGVTEVNSESNTSENDITYIINSKVKSRKNLLYWLDGLKCQLGNFPDIQDEDVQAFVQCNPQNVYETKKCFGIDYLRFQKGKYTLVLDDDNNIEGAWPMRIYEAMWNNVIPIFTPRAFDKFKDVYRTTIDYFLVVGDRDELKELIEDLNSDEAFRSQMILKGKEFMKKFVFDDLRLSRLSSRVIKGAIQESK